MTPSSAATTSTTMSVTWAPRARIMVNASWPGVSRKTIFLPRALDLVGADVLGDAAELALGDLGGADGVEQRGLAVVDVAHDGDHRRARRTCPRDGWRGPSSCLSWTSSSKVTTIASTPRSSASLRASSGSSTWLMLARMPRSNSTLIRSRDLTPSFSENSRTVMPSAMVIGPAGAATRKVSTLAPSSVSARCARRGGRGGWRCPARPRRPRSPGPCRGRSANRRRRSRPRFRTAS